MVAAPGDDGVKLTEQLEVAVVELANSAQLEALKLPDTVLAPPRAKVTVPVGLVMAPGLEASRAVTVHEEAVSTMTVDGTHAISVVVLLRLTVKSFESTLAPWVRSPL